MHWYKESKRFTDKEHDWPRNKDGKKSKRPKRVQMEAAGAVVGVTDVLSGFANAFWMPKYFGEMGIQAGLDGGSLEEATKLFNIRKSKPADEGTGVHQIIADYLSTGTIHEDPRTVLLLEDVDAFLLDKSAYMSEETFTADIDTFKYGGTIDVISDTHVIDWKTCKKGRTPYWKEAAQLAAYDQKQMRQCTNVYIDRDTWRIVGIKKWSKDQIMYGWELFELNYKAQEILRMKI